MRHDKWLSTTSNVFAQNNLYRFALVVLYIGLVVNSVLTYKAVKFQRVILIPPQLTGTIEFVNGQPTDRYVEDMARRIKEVPLLVPRRHGGPLGIEKLLRAERRGSSWWSESHGGHGTTAEEAPRPPTGVWQQRNPWWHQPSAASAR